MKVSEVRELLKTYTTEEMKYLIVELYKSIPKGMREDKGIDHLVKDPHPQPKKKEKDITDPEVLKALFTEIEDFIGNAYAHNYVAPNRVVPKSERSKWRFKVKNYIKQLNQLLPCDPIGHQATLALCDLYEMLCHACSYYLFNSDDPFNSIGSLQSDMFQQVLSRLFAYDRSPETLHKAIKMATKDDLDANTVNEELLFILINLLQESIDIEMTLQIAKEEYLKIMQNMKKVKKHNITYSMRNVAKVYCNLICMLHIRRGDDQEAVQYYKQEMKELDEDNVYDFLNILYWFDKIDLFKQEYEDAKRTGKRLSYSQEQLYAYVKAHGEWPNP